jgi:hypothetical protein
MFSWTVQLKCLGTRPLVPSPRALKCRTAFSSDTHANKLLHRPGTALEISGNDDKLTHVPCFHAHSGMFPHGRNNAQLPGTVTKQEWAASIVPRIFFTARPADSFARRTYALQCLGDQSVQPRILQLHISDFDKRSLNFERTAGTVCIVFSITLGFEVEL